jgi:hypothetical protein
VNWLDGEALGKDPRNERLRKVLAQTQAMTRPKEAKDDRK